MDLMHVHTSIKFRKQDEQGALARGRASLDLRDAVSSVQLAVDGTVTTLESAVRPYILHNVIKSLPNEVLVMIVEQVYDLEKTDTDTDTENYNINLTLFFHPLYQGISSCSGYFALTVVLEKLAIGSTRIPSILFCVCRLIFAAVTYAFSHYPRYHRRVPRIYGIEHPAYKPHDIVLVTLFLWFGSASSTNGPHSAPAPTPSLLDRVSLLSAAAVAYGVLAGTIYNFATQLTFIFGYDDCLNIFVSHAIGGVVGNVTTARDHYWVQLADSTAGMSHSFVMTTFILWLMHFVPGLRLRSDEETEILGVDNAELAYDYVGLDAELSAHIPHTSSGPGAEGGECEPRPFSPLPRYGRP